MESTEDEQITKPASLKIVRKRLHWFAIAIIVLAIGAAATVAFAVTPVNGGSVGHPAPRQIQVQITQAHFFEVR